MKRKPPALAGGKFRRGTDGGLFFLIRLAYRKKIPVNLLPSGVRFPQTEKRLSNVTRRERGKNFIQKGKSNEDATQEETDEKNLDEKEQHERESITIRPKSQAENNERKRHAEFADAD